MAEGYGAKFNAARSSRCPIHKGDNPNAFHLYDPNGGQRLTKWHCFTNCPDGHNDGNAIDLYMRMENKTDFQEVFQELCQKYLAEPGARDARPVKREPVHTSQPPTIRPTHEPHPMWVTRATAFVEYAERILWTKEGRPIRRWLNDERGLSDETIAAARLGLNLQDVFDAPGKWGDQSERKIYCSMGVTIPHFIDGELRFVNVRRPLPGDGLAAVMGKHVRVKDGEKPEKYQGPRGGRRGMYGLDQMKRLPIAIMTEGEFDRLLAWQMVGELADVVTIGGARMRLDIQGATALLSAPIILSTYDEDESGDKGRAYLAGVSDRIETLRVPDHDLTDYWRHGGPLGAWLADQIMRRMEQLLADIDEERHSQTFVRWLEIYQRSREMCRPNISKYTGDRALLAELMKIGFRALNVE